MFTKSASTEKRTHIAGNAADAFHSLIREPEKGAVLLRSNNRSEYTNERLKVLLRESWEQEIKLKERQLGRILTEDEKRLIKIDKEFIGRWHKSGKLPHFSTLCQHFGGIIHLANLLELPATFASPPMHFEMADKDLYIGRLREYAERFQLQEKRSIGRKELITAVRENKVPQVPTKLFKHLMAAVIFEQLGIGIIKTHGKKTKYTTDDLLSVLKLAYEEKCLQVAVELDKPELTPAEKENVKLTIKDYIAFKKKDGKRYPKLATIQKRLNPYWANCLKMAGLPN